MKLHWLTPQAQLELFDKDGCLHAPVASLKEFLSNDVHSWRQLHFMIFYRRLECVRALVQAGASLAPVQSSETGWFCPLDSAVSVSPLPWLPSLAEFVWELSPAKFHQRPIKPLLSRAIETPEAVRFLLEKGVSPNEASQAGSSALSFSSLHSDKHVSLLRVRQSCRLLLDAGAVLDFEDPAEDGQTPLSLAAMGERWPLVKFFLARGASIYPTQSPSIAHWIGQAPSPHPAHRWLAFRKAYDLEKGTSKELRSPGRFKRL